MQKEKTVLKESYIRVNLLAITDIKIKKYKNGKIYFFPSSFERSLALITAFINAALIPASSRA